MIGLSWHCKYSSRITNSDSLSSPTRRARSGTSTFCNPFVAMLSNIPINPRWWAQYVTSLACDVNNSILPKTSNSRTLLGTRTPFDVCWWRKWLVSTSRRSDCNWNWNGTPQSASLCAPCSTAPSPSRNRQHHPLSARSSACTALKNCGCCVRLLLHMLRKLSDANDCGERQPLL